MKRLLVFLVLAAGLLASPSAAQNEGRVEARFECRPASVEVGEPFELVLELTHPSSADLFDLGDQDLVLDDTWVVFGRRLEAPRLLERPDTGLPDAGGQALTRRVWTLASLEPGERGLAETVSSLVADARVVTVDASSTTVEVLGVLAEGESEPRPPRGFPEGFGREPESAPSPWRWPALAAAALAWAAVLWVVVRKLRGPRRSALPAARPPRERLAELRAQPAASPEAVRARHFELTSLVRVAVDEKLARPAAGRTDAEWLAELERASIVDSDLSGELEALFEEAEAVKYAGSLPTSWALEESYARAQRALERVERQPAGQSLAGAGEGSS